MLFQQNPPGGFIAASWLVVVLEPYVLIGAVVLLAAIFIGGLVLVFKGLKQ
jgi:hypothetical protein